MLDDLLQDWTTTSVASTRDISLLGQVESELEARFWKALKDWAAAEPAVSLTPAATVNGRSTAALRTDSRALAGHPAAPARGTIPDVEFARTDQTPLKVVVYLDGYKYHAAPDKNRLAEDADKRAGLRADGTVVFQLDWDDVNAMAGDAITEDMPWPPYQGNAQARARTAYQKARRRPGRAAGHDLVQPGADPVRVPDRPRPDALAAPRGGRGGRALHRPGPREPGDIDRTDRGVSPGAAASRRWRRPHRARPRHGRQRLPRHGPHRPAGQERGEPPRRVDRADRDRRPAGDDLGGREGARRRWAAWLYWGNLVQFLSDGAGDGDQIAYTNLELFDPHLLASALKVASSSGLRTYYSLNRRSQAEATPWAASLPQTPVPPAGVDVSWPVDLLAPEVGPLAHQLADLGVPAPAEDQVGYELNDQGWQAELAWARPAGRGHRGRGRGVHRGVRGGGLGRPLAGDWPPEELAARILGGDSNGPVAAARTRPTRRSTSWPGRSRARSRTSCGSSARTRTALACGSSSSRATPGCTRRGSPTTTGR